MRCLHCGKDMPLLKRLTGGEFCSDEHRQAYQREYSQMALSRLLQAKPPIAQDEPAGATKEAGQELALLKRGPTPRKSGPISLGLSGDPRTAEPPVPANKALQPATTPSRREPAPSKYLEAGKTDISKPDTGKAEAPKSNPKPDPARPDQSKPDQSKLDQSKLDQTRPDQSKDHAAAKANLSKADASSDAKAAGKPGRGPRDAAAEIAPPEQPTAHNQNTFRASSTAESQAYTGGKPNVSGDARQAADENKTAAAEAKAPAPMAKGLPELPPLATVEALAPREIAAEAEPFPQPTHWPTTQFAPRFAGLAKMGAVKFFEGALPEASASLEKSAPALALGNPAEGEGGFAEFTRTASIVTARNADWEAAQAWDSGQDPPHVRPPVTARAAVMVALCPAPATGKIWHSSACSLQEMKLQVGGLARLSFSNAEAEEIEPRDTARPAEKRGGDRRNPAANGGGESNLSRGAQDIAQDIKDKSADDKSEDDRNQENGNESDQPAAAEADPNRVEVLTAPVPALAEASRAALPAELHAASSSAPSANNGSGSSKKPAVIRLMRPAPLRSAAPLEKVTSET